MNPLFMLVALVLSMATFAQTKFIIPADPGKSNHFSHFKKNHQIVLKTYRQQLESQIKRLVNGIDHESENESGRLTVPKYDRLLAEILIKRFFILSLEEQLKNVALEIYSNAFHVSGEGKYKKVFNTERIKIDADRIVTEQISDLLVEDDFHHAVINDLKFRLLREIIYCTTAHTYRAIGGGLVMQILAEGVVGNTLRGAVLSLGSEILVSTLRGSALVALAFPLQSHRRPPESIWFNILEKRPELIFNPEWMILAGSPDEPWATHGLATIREPKRMARVLDNYLKAEEKSFKNRILEIHALAHRSQLETIKAESRVLHPEEEYFIQVKDNVRVTPVLKRVPITLPSWASKT